MGSGVVIWGFIPVYGGVGKGARTVTCLKAAQPLDPQSSTPPIILVTDRLTSEYYTSDDSIITIITQIAIDWDV
jgi:hypothetical protein